MQTVTRQVNTYTGDQVVEISDGSLDYSNPGALCKRYPGEFDSFDDPREAVETAIKIAKAWQADKPEETILIASGGTGGCTMFFEGEPLTDETFEGLQEQAEKAWEELPKCSRCGEVMGKEKWTHPDMFSEEEYCSENCADLAWEQICRWEDEGDEARDEDR